MPPSLQGFNTPVITRFAGLAHQSYDPSPAVQTSEDLSWRDVWRWIARTGSCNDGV